MCCGKADASGKGDAGFTLMEVLVALLILSTSIYILLGHHYSIMGLQNTISDELTYNQLVETVVGKAEFGVLTNKLADAGDFGDRFAEYTWSYNAMLQSEDELIPLYAIQVSINSPSDSRTYDLFFYHTGNPESGEEGRLSGGRDSSRSGSASSRNNDRGGTEPSTRSRNAASRRESERNSSRSSDGIGRGSRGRL